jgi:predicted dehydrogenase
MLTSSLSRRQFLAASALAAIPLARVHARLITNRSSNDTLGIAFIGTGKRGFELLPAFLKEPDCRVLAACDVDTTRRLHAQSIINSKYGNTDCRVFNDHRELLAMPGIDAVVITTPDHWHINQIIDSCNSKKDIYCEKPLTDTLLECRLAIEAARKHGVVFQTGSQQRTEYGGRFVHACEIVRSGRLGQLLTVHVGVGASSTWCDLPEEPVEPGLDWDRWLGPAPVRPFHSALSPRGIHSHYPDWRKYREYAGGLLTDWGAHHFDIVQWALNMDTSGPVEARPPAFTHDEASPFGGSLVYESGLEIVHGGTNGILFVGTEGTLFVNRDRIQSFPDRIANDPLPDSAKVLPRVPSHIRNWLDCIKTRQKPICDVEVGARSIACAHLLNLAYWRRRPVLWDPALWQFRSDEPPASLDRERRNAYAIPPIA